MSYYQELIADICQEHKLRSDPRHIEGFMLLEYNTLGHLPRSRFVKEAKLFDQNCRDNLQEWEDNAKSFGL